MSSIGAFSYITALLTFFLGADNIYWFTAQEPNYGGFYAKEINRKFGTTLVNEHAPVYHSASGGSSYYLDKDIGLRTLFVKNNSRDKIVNAGGVRLIFCPLPKYFIVHRYDFAISRESDLAENCGTVRNVSPILPNSTSRLYFFSEKPPRFIEDPRSSSDLISGEWTLEWQLVIRGIMFFVAVNLMFSLIVPATNLIATAMTFSLKKIIGLKLKEGRLLRVAAFAASLVGLAIILFGPILALSDYELAGEYDNEPGLLLSGMQLVLAPVPKADLIADAVKTGKYEVAVALQRSIVTDTERAETESIGKPGFATAENLGLLAWYALLAGKFEDALAAAERGLSLSPEQMWIETNRDHALLLLGHVDEARTLYLERKGMRLRSGGFWEDVVREDFRQLRKASIESPMFAEMETLMSGSQNIEGNLHTSGDAKSEPSTVPSHSQTQTNSSH